MLITKNKYLPFYMWLLPLAFFAYQFILRLWPGLTMLQIMEQFSIDATDFGMLAAFYYYGYAGMQIPVAILLDRFGPKHIICVSALICGSATVLFTFTNNFYLALLSRFLIGAGSAVGFLGVSKVISVWFPKEQYARMIGFSFTIGLLGAIYGGKPISLLIENYSRQNIAVALAVISMLIGVGTYLMLRVPSNTNVATQQQIKMSNLNSAFRSPLIWRLAVANLLMVGSLEGFADVWGVQYLSIAYDLNKADAAGLVSFIFFGMLIGGPLLSWVSKRFGNYFVICLCGIGMAFAFILLLLTQTYNPVLLSSLFFAVGVMCCYQVLVFAAGSSLVAPQYLGVTIAFLNCINMLGGSFFHTTIGKIMDLFWTGAVSSDGLRVYDLIGYKYSLSVVPICAFIGVALILWMWYSIKTFNIPVTTPDHIIGLHNET